MRVLSTTQRLLRLQELIELGHQMEEWEIRMVQAMIERRNMGISFTALQQKKIMDIHMKYRESGYASAVR